MFDFLPKPWNRVKGGSLFIIRWNNEYRTRNVEGWKKRKRIMIWKNGWFPIHYSTFLFDNTFRLFRFMLL